MLAEYQTRLDARRRAIAEHEKTHRTLSNYRFAAVVAAAFVAWWDFLLLPIPVGAFLALMVWHDRVDRKLRAERRGAEYYDRAIARLENRWQSFGETGERFRKPEHPYADDLDVFGRGSLFQLLTAARTTAGENTLAAWLSQSSPVEDVIARQAAIDDLRDRLDLREELALLGQDIQAEVHPDRLLRWGTAPAVHFPAFARFAAALLATFTVTAGVGWFLQQWNLRPFLVGVLIQSIFGFWLRDRVRAVVEGADTPSHDLGILAELLARFESEPFKAPRLQQLKNDLETSGAPASKRIAKLQRLTEMHEWAHNQAFVLFARLLLWDTQLAIAIEDWRQKSGPRIARWVQAVGELEALSSIAGYAYDHPEDVFPGFSADAPLFHGEGIAHPLLPTHTAIRNDVRLDGEQRLLLVSGSNMSGKSTLLRSVGLNTVLAWAGAPVRATKLLVSPLAIGASIRIVDSLQDGKSRFYAEITRLRQIMDMASGPEPLLFLLDEMLSGTNSHDRRIGAEAMVRSLVERRAIGLVTTHDLALAEIAETMAPLAVNVHFEDHIEDGRIAFDYRMRPGIIRKSNALELMRSVGLDV